MFNPKDLNAVVVFSGGQDSTTCLYWAIQRYNKVLAITFDYNQRHRREIEAATTICKMAGVEHEIIELGPILKGRSPLTNPNEPLETYTDYQSMDKIIGDRIELTFVPMRNALFLTIAANRATVFGASRIVTGVCQQDNANYPDCRKDFIWSQESTINVALGLPSRHLKPLSLTIDTPVIDLSKAGTIAMAKAIPGCMEAMAYSHTAYDGSYPPNGNDHASVLRAQGFVEADEPDPLILRAWREGKLESLPLTTNYDPVRK